LFLRRLAVNATTMPDGATIQHKSIKPRPSPRPRCGTPLSLVIVDEVDEKSHRLRDPFMHHLFQEDVPRGRATPEVMPSSDPKDSDLGFPLEHRPESDDRSKDASNKVMTAEEATIVGSDCSQPNFHRLAPWLHPAQQSCDALFTIDLAGEVSTPSTVLLPRLQHHGARRSHHTLAEDTVPGQDWSTCVGVRWDPAVVGRALTVRALWR
jgi:hypothetical protein